MIGLNSTLPNILLLGDAGTGKTELVNYIAGGLVEDISLEKIAEDFAGTEMLFSSMLDRSTHFQVRENSNQQMKI